MISSSLYSIRKSSLRLLAISAVAILWTTASAQESKHYCINIGDFSEVTVANNINVRYRCLPDSAGWAVFDCPPATADAVTFQNSKGKLKVQVITDNPVTDLPTVTIYSMALRKCANWGDSTIVVENNAPGPEFKAGVIGNGNIAAQGVWATKVSASVKAGMGRVFLEGKAQNANFTLWSTGAIEAGGLEASEVKCTVVGTGSIDCSPSEILKISGMGSGTVYYKGDPKVKNHGLGVHLVQVQ